jgi:SAM-dependent methyltransferase
MNEDVAKSPTWEGPEFQTLLPILFGYAHFQLLRTAVEVDLFTKLSTNPGQTREELEGALGLPLHSARLLLVGCCSIGLVRREDGKYFNSEPANALLVRERRVSAIPFVQGAHALQYKGFYHMLEALRTGTNAGLCEYPGEGKTLYERMSKDSHLETTLYDAMNTIWDLCQDGLNDLEPYRRTSRILDVAGGAGRVAKLLTEKYPHLCVTVFDRPTACERVRNNAAQWGRERSIFAMPGDLLNDDFPGGFDGINFAHCLEWLSPAQIAHVLRKAYQALPAGGRVFCFQFAINDDETGPAYSARLSMYFLVNETGQGMAYPASELVEMFKEAGFADVEVHRNLPFEHVFISGIKGEC